MACVRNTGSNPVRVALVDAADHRRVVRAGRDTRGSEAGGGSEFFLFNQRSRYPANQKDRATFSLAAGSDSGRVVARYFIAAIDRKSTRLNSSHVKISYAVF